MKCSFLQKLKQVDQLLSIGIVQPILIQSMFLNSLNLDMEGLHHKKMV